jgi:ribosome-associated toxin RatA of RatAB toxin-antitoxin module
LEFDIAFCFASPLHRRVAGLFVQEVVKKMVAAFEGRCQELYGRPAPCT